MACATIGCQSSTAARTSRRTRSSLSTIRGSDSCVKSRSIRKHIHDSAMAPSGRGSSTSRSRIARRFPCGSRSTTSCGCMTSRMNRPSSVSAAVTESTRKGMSSVTMAATVARPSSSRRRTTLDVPANRRAASCLTRETWPKIAGTPIEPTSSLAICRENRGTRNLRSSSCSPSRAVMRLLARSCTRLR